MLAVEAQHRSVGTVPRAGIGPRAPPGENPAESESSPGGAARRPREQRIRAFTQLSMTKIKKNKIGMAGYGSFINARHGQARKQTRFSKNELDLAA